MWSLERTISADTGNGAGGSKLVCYTDWGYCPYGTSMGILIIKLVQRMVGVMDWNERTWDSYWVHAIFIYFLLPLEAHWNWKWLCLLFLFYFHFLFIYLHKIFCAFAHLFILFYFLIKNVFINCGFESLQIISKLSINLFCVFLSFYNNTHLKFFIIFKVINKFNVIYQFLF